MKKRWNSILMILFDAAVITFGELSIACSVPSSFSVPFEAGTLVWSFAIGALLMSAWMHLPKRGVIFGTVFIAAIVVYGILDRHAIADGARYTWNGVIEPLSMDFPMLQTPEILEEIENPTAAVTSFLMIVGEASGMFLTFALIRGRMALLSVLIPLPTFLLSLVYTDQPPALWTVIMLMLYCGGALLGQGVRRGNEERIGWFETVLIPLLLVYALLISAFSPASRFTPIPFEQRKELLGERAEAIGDSLMSLFRKNPKEYDLNHLNDRNRDDTRAFTVRASVSGTFLMRTRSYGRYQDGVWLEAEEYDGDWRSMTALSAHGTGRGGTVTVKNALLSERYVPYAFYSGPGLKIGESYIQTASRTSYEWVVADSVTMRSSGISDAERAYLQFAKEQYTMPDGEEKESLLSIAQAAGLNVQGDNYHVASIVASYVKNAGTYTLNPPRTPRGRGFVEYFLTESHSGYCVHFASATTALLQAMNIPARYTIGYHAVIPVADVWTDVKENSAHAWTEIYQPGVGWIPIESTAGFSYDIRSTEQASGGTYTSRPTAKPTETPTSDRPEHSGEEEQNETDFDDLQERLRTPKPMPTEGAEATDQPSIIGEGNVVVTPEDGSAAWWLLLLVPVLPSVWIVVGIMIRKRRSAAFRQKNARMAILEMLHYMRKLERFGVKPDPRAQEWEEEAAFSNHDMSDTRRLLLNRVRKEQDHLYLDAPFKRFIVKWVLIAI